MIYFLPLHLNELGAFSRISTTLSISEEVMSFISKAAIIRKMLQQKSVASQFQQHAQIIGDRIHLAVFNSTQI